jgi:hypothetical protein
VVKTAGKIFMKRSTIKEARNIISERQIKETLLKTTAEQLINVMIESTNDPKVIKLLETALEINKSSITEADEKGVFNFLKGKLAQFKTTKDRKKIDAMQASLQKLSNSSDPNIARAAQKAAKMAMKDPVLSKKLGMSKNKKSNQTLIKILKTIPIKLQKPPTAGMDRAKKVLTSLEGGAEPIRNFSDTDIMSLYQYVTTLLAQASRVQGMGSKSKIPTN